jgi:hypothetical protein
MALLSVVRHNAEKATKICGLFLQTCLAHKLASQKASGDCCGRLWSSESMRELQELTGINK